MIKPCRMLTIALALSLVLWAGIIALIVWLIPVAVDGVPRPVLEHQCLYGTSQVLKPCPSDVRPSAVLVTSDRYADYWTEATRPNITVAVPK